MELMELMELDDLYGTWLAQQMAASRAQQAQYQAIIGTQMNDARQALILGGLFSPGQLIPVRNLNDAAQVQFDGQQVFIKYVPVRRRRTFLQKLLRRPYDRSQERDVSDRELVLPVGSMREV